MKAAKSIKRELQATIGRYALDVAGADPAIISFTRPRPNVVYLTFARAPENEAGAKALDKLFSAFVDDARENGDCIVLANAQVETLFGGHPLLTTLVGAA